MSAFGCGGGGGAGNCSQPAACGGDVVGTWTASSTCLSLSESGFISNCPRATLTASGISVTGNTTLKADLTYTETFATSGDFAVFVPLSCLAFQGQQETCAQYETGLRQAASPFSSVSCTSDSDGCSCALTVNGQPATKTGTYSTVNNIITETVDGDPNGTGTLDASDYCVQGNKLLLAPRLDMTGMPVGMVTGSGRLELTKQ